jgi:hypothetical protein
MDGWGGARMMTGSESSTRELEGGERGDDDERRGARNESTRRDDATRRRDARGDVRFDSIRSIAKAATRLID